MNGIILAIVIVFFLWLGRSILIPLLVATFLWYLINAIEKYFHLIMTQTENHDPWQPGHLIGHLIY